MDIPFRKIVSPSCAPMILRSLVFLYFRQAKFRADLPAKWLPPYSRVWVVRKMGRVMCFI